MRCLSKMSDIMLAATNGTYNENDRDLMMVPITELEKEIKHIATQITLLLIQHRQLPVFQMRIWQRKWRK